MQGQKKSNLEDIAIMQREENKTKQNKIINITFKEVSEDIAIMKQEQDVCFNKATFRGQN